MIRSMIKWLYAEPKGFHETVRLVAKGLLIISITSSIIVWILELSRYDFPETANHVAIHRMFDTYTTFGIYYLLMLSSIAEEIIFRVPLFVFSVFDRLWLLLVVSIISSFGFGLAHGFTVGDVATKGVIGLIFCVYFLKAGGVRGRFFKPLAVTTSIHIILDWTIATVAIYMTPRIL